MSQPTDIHVPVAADGTCPPNTFAVDLNDTIDALVSSHLGSARPSYATEGTIWVDTVTSSRRDINLFDGVNDLRIASYDPTTHALTYIAIPDHSIDVVKLEADIFDALTAVTPAADDYVIGIDTSDDNKTKKFAVADIIGAAAASFPAGSIMPFAGSSAPTGWAICDGSPYSRTSYADLYTAIGITWGAGDGSTTFNIPDLQGKGLIGAGTGTIAEKVPFSAVTVAADTITVASNKDKWITGKKVRLTTTGGLPGGLATATDYYVNRVDATTIKLSTAQVLALGGSVINITSQGTGNHTIIETLPARTLGEVGGESDHAINVSEAAITYANGGGGVTSLTHQTNVLNTNSTVTPMSLMNPYGVVNWIIKT